MSLHTGPLGNWANSVSRASSSKIRMDKEVTQAVTASAIDLMSGYERLPGTEQNEMV